VLGKFTKAERPEVAALVERAADAVEEWVGAGIESAMNRFN
jgi:peptidyl-tRNA hydrolase